MEYDHTNRGAIFPNDRKQSDQQPDYRGSINVEGTEYWISGWKKTAKTGNVFLSVSVRPKDEEGGGGTKQAPDTGSVPF